MTREEIRSMDLDTAENIDELNQEVDALNERKKELQNDVEKRRALRTKVMNGAGTQVEKPKEQRTMNFTAANVVQSPEYRSAWLNNLRGVQLSEVEQRALTTAVSSVGSVIPTTTQNKIIEKVHQYAPLLDEIELLHVKGYVVIPAEGTTIDAKVHAEGAAITADADTMNKVSLGAFEVTKLVTISKSVETMSIDAFEAWLVNKIARKVAELDLEKLKVLKKSHGMQQTQ